MHLRRATIRVGINLHTLALRACPCSLIIALTLAASPASARQLPEINALATSVPVASSRGPEFGVGSLEGIKGRAHERLNLPVFVWGTDKRLTAPASQAGSRESAARWQLKNLASAYRIDSADIDLLPVKESRALANGASLVKFTNAVQGIEVFAEEAAVLTRGDGSLVAIGGFVSSGGAAARQDKSDLFRLSAADAIARALQDFSFDPSVAHQLQASGQHGAYTSFDLTIGIAGRDGAVMRQPARCKPVWFRMPDGLLPAWYVEVQVADATGEAPHYFAYVISAQTGETLFRHSQETELQAFSYRVWAEPSWRYLPYPGPQGRNGSPHPTGQPDGYQAPFVAPNLITLVSTNFLGDPWLPDDASVTTGNNVEAFADIVSPDGYNAGDIRADISLANTLNRTYDVTQAPNVSVDQIKAAVTELFYVNNWMHDWYYNVGFDELSGNAQTSNYGRGGLGFDSMLAEGQDHAGTNNADMSTPADGSRPRMRTYVYINNRSGALATDVSINTWTVAGAAWGAANFAVGPKPIIYAQPNDGCTALTNAAQMPLSIALIDRGTCDFTTQAQNAQNAGAIGLIVANNTTGVTFMPGSGPAIHSLMISQADGNTLKAAMGSGTVNGTLTSVTGVDRDATIDNQIIAHEWGHYLTNRLVGNASGLGTEQSLAMGEGWSDFNALLMTVKEEDSQLPSGANYFGVYALGGYTNVAHAPPHQSYYFGNRRYPYSTDLTKNPLTFRHIQQGVALPNDPAPAFGQDGSYNTELHNTGEVWASMLWECYASLLRDSARLTFDEAQFRMRGYLVLGLKLTPVNPTFVEARDALLAAMAAQDHLDDLQLCRAGFARRGLGVDAVAPDRFDIHNAGVVESYNPGVELIFAHGFEDPAP